MSRSPPTSLEPSAPLDAGGPLPAPAPSAAASEAGRRLCALLLRLGRRGSLRNPVAALCEELQLTPSQLHSLVWLGHDGPLPMGELARRLGVTVKTVTGVVDRLERTGLARRARAASGDRRVVQVALSDEGARTFERLRDTATERLALLVERLDASQQEALFGFLEGLAGKLEGTPDGGPPDRGAERARAPLPTPD